VQICAKTKAASATCSKLRWIVTPQMVATHKHANDSKERKRKKSSMFDQKIIFHGEKLRRAFEWHVQ